MTGQQCVEAEEPIEMFGILQRLPEITTRFGNVAVNEVLDEFAHDASIISLFAFMRERLKITLDEFRESCAVLLAKHPSCTVVGYVSMDGAFLVMSQRSGEDINVRDPREPHIGWPKGSLILSTAFRSRPVPQRSSQPASPPVLSNHFEPYALV